ncbi:C-C chemokine receptor type 4-like [Antedon mediterranea]|uniref:C-C chemokine receptor type 4-like n=1 Tax=Antedon mediterranea TaxID=105859 RepID=UPI003AF45F1D
MTTCDNLNITVEEISDEVELALSISRYTLTIIGVIANLVVIIVFINCKIYRKCFTYTLIFQQAFIDLIACCSYLILFNYNVPDGHAGVVYCKSRTLFWLFASGSTFNLVYISIERYIAVVHPMRYWARGEWKNKMLPQLFVQFVFSALVVFQLSIFSRPDDLSPGKCRYCHGSETVRVISGGSIFLLNWVIPISIMMFCYRRVYVTMLKHSKSKTKWRKTPSSDQTDATTEDTATDTEQGTGIDLKIDRTSNSTRYSKAQVNFVITMVISAFVFLLSITPLLVLYFVYVLCDCFDYDRHPLRQAAIICFVSSLAANPFVYAFKFNEFKSGFRKTFFRRDKK